MKLGSMGVVTLTALAVVCLANAPPARANSIDGSVVYGIMGLDTSLSPNYFDPSTPNTAFNSQWENTSATFQTFDGTTIGAVPISDTAIEFGTHLASNLTLTADFYSGGSGGLNLVFNLPPGIPSTLYLYFADAAFAGLTLTPAMFVLQWRAVIGFLTVHLIVRSPTYIITSSLLVMDR